MWSIIDIFDRRISQKQSKRLLWPDARDFIMPGERPEPALTGRYSDIRQMRRIAPFQPFPDRETNR
jgi:hypothetical protein